MKKEFQQIRDTLDRLDKIHIRHIESFDADLMPDLQRQLIERKNEFDKLKTAVNKIITASGFENEAETESMISFFIERINTLLGQNKMLKKKVKVHRDGFQESMKNMSRGKQAIGAYRSPSSVSNKPRAINLTN